MNTFMEPGNYRQTQILGSLGQRLSGFCAGQWDLNAIWLLREDLQACLSLLSGQLSSTVQQSIDNIIHVLTHCIESTQFPDSGQTAQLAVLSHDLYAADSAQVKSDAETSPIDNASDTATTRAETPPKAFWRQWSEDAMPSQALSSHASLVPITQEAPTTGTSAMQDSNDNQAASSHMASEINTSSRHLRIYHVTDYSALSIQLDQILEKQGFDVELLGTELELQELLLALPADLVLIDASYSKNSTNIQSIIADYKKTSAKPLIAVQLSADAEAAETTRLANSAIDVVYSQNTDANSLVAHIDQLLKFGKGEQFRVLIVEDDRSQAMFAEGILRNAEISTKVLLSAENLLATIEEFKPDLILMDMYLPNANGIQLTELIRNSSHFQNTPIVFLSGESDEDKQMDALEAGGDDFLTKPIRPRRLIAAVQNRIKRHRALQLGAQPETPAAANTNGGLMHRTDMLDCMKKNIDSSNHALMYIELNGLNLLKDRLGLSALESLLKQFSQFLVKTCEAYPIARFSDGAFVMIYQGDCTESGLQKAAAKIRHQLMTQKFNVQDQIIEPRIQIGVCHFEHGDNTDLLITTAERTARSARAEASGILIYQPQASGEMLKEQRIVSLLNETNQGSALSHVYQPIVAVAGSDEKQFQTLLRLNDENGQVIPAAEFIPIAEKSNLIIGIDRWSISKAVSTIAAQANANNEMKLFVNQSNVTMLDPEHLGWLKNLLKANKIPDNCLVIEINHDDALLNQKSIHDFCQALIYSGIQFCLSRYNPKNDDSNLLESLPLSYVKLAHKFTSGSATQAVRDQIKLLVDRAHRHGLEVIGHSVEDAQTAATLWMSGIDYIQGNLVQSANNHLDFGFDQSVL